MELFTAYMMLWQIAVIYDSKLEIEHTQTSAGINIENKNSNVVSWFNLLCAVCSWCYIYGFVPERRNSSALAMELRIALPIDM